MYKIPDRVKNKYEFVTLAAKRAEQLQAGALPRVECGSPKATVIAQAEVAEGVVTAYDPERATFEVGVEEEEEE